MMAESDSSGKLSTGAIGQDTNSAAIPKPDFKEDSKPELKVIDSMAGYTHDHEPPPRFWHFSQLVRDKVYVGGGCVPEFKSEEGRNSLTRIIEQFDVSDRSWHRLVTKGTPHPGLSAVACASFGNYLYAYGGSNLQRLSGVLSQLDLDTLTWSQLSPETKDGPMRKDASGMVHFSEDKLAVVCGYAHPNDLGNLKTGGSSDIKSEFIQRRIRKPAINDVGGWTNEMHIFSIKESSWCTPFFTGQRPPPCADFTLTSINNFRAILYGGDRGINVDSQDLYLLDLKNLDISKVTPKHKEDKWPPLRMGQHVACCLGFNTDNPHLLISGGRLEKQHLPYKDMWLLNSTSWTWWEVELPSDTVQNRLGRWGHTATTITHSEGLEEVIMFGGSRGLYEVTWDVKKKEDFHRWADPISFIFGKKMVLFKIIDTNQQKNDKKVMKENLYTISEIKMEESTTREKSSPTMEESYKIGLRGVDVCGETCITVTNSIQYFEWERFGLKVHIEENSLPADIEQMTVNIKASISGHYESPEGYDRVSAVFWFQCEPNIELKKQVTVEIQHCAMLEHTSELSFARAMCTQEKLPYTFKLLKGGQFSNQSSYGVLSLNRFSGIAAFSEKSASAKRKYRASLFHLTKEPNHEVHVLVTWDSDPYLEVFQRKHRNAQPGIEQKIIFESEEISINIPMEGIHSPNGWKIIPLKPPVIEKKDVDDYKHGQLIPSCQLLAVVDQNTTGPLQHTITLTGAKPPCNAFNIYIDHGIQNRNRGASEPSTSSTYCLSDVDSSVTLDEDDLVDVMEEVVSRKAAYFALGRALRIPVGELEAVQEQHPKNLDSALHAVLLLWLREKYNAERFGSPTWQMLVKAVESSVGLNDHALAQKIAQKHTTHH